MDVESILQGMVALSVGMAALGFASLREPIFNPPRFRWHRVGGLQHFAAWRFGGSFYLRSYDRTR